MDERQCRRAALTAAPLVVAAKEAKEGLPWAVGEEAEASRRPQRRAGAIVSPNKGGSFGNGACRVGTGSCRRRVQVHDKRADRA